ncbi:hypothetical protein ACFY1U_45255 [Streptomyces sp. NPDC001351]
MRFPGGKERIVRLAGVPRTDDEGCLIVASWVREHPGRVMALTDMVP